MKIRVIAVGKVREPYIAAAIADFCARLQHYDGVTVFEVTASHGADPQRAVREEGERVLRALASGETLWLLERTGTQLSSVELAQRLETLGAAGHTRLTVAIAGTYGASEALLERADFHWSLSRLTLLHEWTRAVVLEQFYRAAKIARNEPYHH